MNGDMTSCHLPSLASDFIVMITESGCSIYTPNEQFLVFKTKESAMRENESLESISEVMSSGKRMEKRLDVKLEKTELTI